MKYSLRPERVYKLIESILAPFQIRNEIDDSWEGKWWKLHGDVPERKIIVWDKDGEAVFTYDRAYKELTISTKHFNKIISYIPLDQKLLETLLIALFGNLSDRKFHVERLDKSDLRRHDKEDLEDDGEEEN